MRGVPDQVPGTRDRGIRHLRGKADAAGPHDPLVVGDLRENDMKRAVLRLEDHDGRPATGYRRLEGVGGLGLDERCHDLAALEAELDTNAIVSHHSSAKWTTKAGIVTQTTMKNTCQEWPLVSDNALRHAVPGASTSTGGVAASGGSRRAHSRERC